MKKKRVVLFNNPLVREKIDKVIKGVEPGRAWDELLMLSTQIAQ